MSSSNKRNFRIAAFRQRVEIDPKSAEKTWKFLEHAIYEIYNYNASGLNFEELYRNLNTFPSCNLVILVENKIFAFLSC